MKTKFFNKITVIGCCLLAMGMTSCNDYLEIYPENVQPTDKYWSSKEEVDATLSSGYYYLREAVESHLIPWGELRAGCVTSRGKSVLQNFEMKPTEKILSKWASMYKIINSANLVLKNAGKALDNDDTYTESLMNSHHCEALWLRSLAYFYIVRNWRDAPLITEPFETDELTFNVAKSSEAEIIAQIKADLNRAITLDAAKEKFNTTWETKGRATKWAILALMTDVCLWNHDYDEAIQYADQILNSTSVSAPRFLTSNSRTNWFSMFNPGNSNESIFEVQWAYEKLSSGSPQTNTLTTSFDPAKTGYKYLYSAAMLDEFKNEIRDLRTKFGTTITTDNYTRSMYAGIQTNDANVDNFENATAGYVWKYYGGTSFNTQRSGVQDDDCNFIIYRVTDIMLLKAEALVMRSMGANASDNQAAIDIINKIRARANLDATTTVTASSSVSDLLVKGVLHERLIELAGEAKAWYDMLRIGRYTDPNGQIDFKTLFINTVTTYNKASSVRSVLSNVNAWYLPINSSEISTNEKLEQNPYYM